MNLSFVRACLLASVLGASLSSITGCDGGESTNGTGGNSTTTESSTDTTPVDPPVTLGMAKVGSPTWEPVDYHQFSVEVGAMFENFGAIGPGLLPPPNHEEHPELGVGPGAAHAGPYDGEIAQGVQDKGYEEHTAFPQADGLLPNAIYSIWMMVPSTGAPMGKTPDSAAGPMIPNTLFPIHVKVDAYQDDMLLDGYSFEFDVPALDMTLNPPFDVEGHSHFPMISAVVFDGMAQPVGTIESRISMLDVGGNGWNLTLQATALAP